MNNRTSHPVAQVDASFERWRRIRVPLFAGVAVVVLIISALLLRSCLIARSIQNEIERIVELSSADTEDGLSQALDAVETLHSEYPDNEEISTRFVWQHVLVALRLGPAESHLEAASSVLSSLDGAQSTALLEAARAGVALLQGNAEQGQQIAAAARAMAADCVECAFVEGLALAALGRQDEGLPLLDQARQGLPPFLPALAAMAELLRDSGRLPEATNALNLLAQAAPNHQGVRIQAILVELDRTGQDQAALGQLAPSLREKLSAVTGSESYPKRASYKSYAAGRLALIDGDVAGATTNLTEAAKVLTKDQALARWLAVAHWRAREHLKALEVIESFGNTEQTDLALLEVRARVLLDIQRTEDAAAPLAILLRNNVKGAAMLEGKRLFEHGDTKQAMDQLNAALSQGEHEAALLLAEAHALRGRVNDARTVLRDSGGDGAVAACSKGLLNHYRGATAQARSRWNEAIKGGGRCGRTYSGRYLIGRGSPESTVEELQKALAEGEDLRDRVALGRALLRTEGAVAAKAELDRVRALEPQGALVYRELVGAYAELGNEELTLEVAREGVTRTKGHPLLAAVAASLAREQGQMDDAKQFVADGLKGRPGASVLLLEKAANQLKRRRLADAEETVNAALVPGPVFGDAACLRAKIQSRRGDRREAQVALNRVAARARTRSGAAEAAQARACLVSHFISRGPASYGKARANVYLLRKSRIVWAEIPFLSGYISERENERDSAAREYRRAIKLDRAHRQAWHRLAKVADLTPEELAAFQKMWPGQEP